MTAELFNYEAERAARAAALPKPTTFERPVRLLSLDVFAPDKPGQPHRAAVVDAHIAGAQSSAELLEQYARALEDIAASFRAAAKQAG